MNKMVKIKQIDVYYQPITYITNKRQLNLAVDQSPNIRDIFLRYQTCTQ